MAPLRRRLSRRIVKTTFQECFEYDIPGFRNTEIKRVSTPVPRHRPKASVIKFKPKEETTPKIVKDIPDKNARQVVLKTKEETAPKIVKDTSDKTARQVVLKSKEGTTSKLVKYTPDKTTRQVALKSKEETSSKIVKVSAEKTARQITQKPKGAENKDESKNFAEKVKDNINKPKTQKANDGMQSSVATRRKIKSAFMGSDYKRFKTSQAKSRSVSSPTNEKPQEENNQVEEETQPVSKLSTNASASDMDLVSKNWQPVVHLKKLSVDESKSFASPEKDKEISTNRQHVQRIVSKSPDLATRLKNALKDPMAEKDDNECGSSENEMTSRMLVDELLTNSLTAKIHQRSRSHIQQSTEDSIHRERRNLKRTAAEMFREVKFHKLHGSDSALEDWPESSSEASDDLESTENFICDEIASLSTLNDWTGPHVSVILHWQKQLNSVTKELRTSFDGLKSIIKEKNSLISALKSKLDHFNENACHKILDRILEDYDKRDSKNPATVIINSILEYSNTKS